MTRPPAAIRKKIRSLRRRSGPRPIQDSSPGGGGLMRAAGNGRPAAAGRGAVPRRLRRRECGPERFDPAAGVRGGKGLSLRSPCGPRRPSRPPCDRSHGAARPRRNRRAAKRPPRRSERETPDGAGEALSSMKPTYRVEKISNAASLATIRPGEAAKARMPAWTSQAAQETWNERRSRRGFPRHAATPRAHPPAKRFEGRAARRHTSGREACPAAGQERTVPQRGDRQRPKSVPAGCRARRWKPPLPHAGNSNRIRVRIDRSRPRIALPRARPSARRRTRRGRPSRAGPGPGKPMMAGRTWRVESGEPPRPARPGEAQRPPRDDPTRRP